MAATRARLPGFPVLTGVVGSSADVMAEIATLYLPAGATVADVTYGNGAFWRLIDTSHYDFRPTDLKDGGDLRALPYDDESVDVLVLDPPYMPSHDGDIKESISEPYNLNGSSPRSMPLVTALYAQGLAEAARVVRPKGLAVVKCQDSTENHRRFWLHVDVLTIARAVGFEGRDLFVLVQQGVPAMRQEAQNHARQNLSYFWVLKKERR